MPRQNKDLEKVTVRIHRGDREILKQFYPSMGYNEAMRILIHNHCKALQERANLAEDEATTDLPDINIT